ncbi:MAG: NlpC/P60 family protein, partial [Candidatus Saccharimonadales bacterium]
MATVSEFTQDALSHQGAHYVYGAARPSGWDCSGFVNWVLCHDLGVGIPGFPGGSFDGST